VTRRNQRTICGGRERSPARGTRRLRGLPTASHGAALVGLLSHGVPSHPRVTPLSPQTRQCHEIVVPSTSNEARISPGHRRRPGLRRHDTFVQGSAADRPLVTHATIAPRNSARLSPGPGMSAMAPAPSRKCLMSVTHVLPIGRLAPITAPTLRAHRDRRDPRYP
jgi:hypothetical protein